jgi:eukaryotic-like serine/threonine-protein kinase
VNDANALGVRDVNSRTSVLGTPGFMAPEQFGGHNIDHRTDLFALGAVLYNLTTGHLPYEGGSVEGIYKNLKRS